MVDDPLIAEVNNLLTTHYPGWCWYVQAPEGGNVVIVRNLDCDPHGKMGMVIHKDKYTSGGAIRAGGEFLERYRMRRGEYREEEVEGRTMLLEKPDE